MKQWFLLLTIMSLIGSRGRISADCSTPVLPAQGARQILVEDIFPDLCQTLSIVDELSTCAVQEFSASLTVTTGDQYYCLAQDIIGDIVITGVSNVTIDLKGYRVTGTISIDTSSDIVIKNGVITPPAPVELSPAAAVAVGNSSFVTLMNLAVNSIDSSIVGGLGRNGVFINNGDNAIILQCVIRGGRGDSGSSAITCEFSDDVVIRESIATSGGANGLFLLFTQRAQIIESSFFGVSPSVNDPASAVLEPIRIVFGQDTLINRCYCQAAPAARDDQRGGTGLADQSSTNTVIENSVFSGADGFSTTSLSSYGGYGIALQGVCIRPTVRNCMILSTGKGADNPTGIGSDGGDGISIESSVVNAQISGCIIGNTGAGGSGFFAPGQGGLAINDLNTATLTTAPNTGSAIFNNTAYNIAGDAGGGARYRIHVLPAGVFVDALPLPRALPDNVYF